MENQTRKRAAIYARIAAARQGEEHDPLRLQIEAVQRYCSEKGYIVNEHHIYQEIVSGADMQRPGVALLLDRAKQGEFDIVVVFALNRLSRNFAKIAVLLATLAGYGVQVESITEPTSDSGVDAAYTQMLLALNEQVTILEKEVLRRRRNAGRRTAEQEEKRT